MIAPRAAARGRAAVGRRAARARDGGALPPDGRAPARAGAGGGAGGGRAVEAERAAAVVAADAAAHRRAGGAPGGAPPAAARVQRARARDEPRDAARRARDAAAHAALGRARVAPDRRSTCGGASTPTRRSRPRKQQPDSEWSCVMLTAGVSAGTHYWEAREKPTPETARSRIHFEPPPSPLHPTARSSPQVHIDATVDGNIMVGVCPAAVDAPTAAAGAYKAPASMMFYAHNGRRCAPSPRVAARRRASPRETRASLPSRVALVALLSTRPRARARAWRLRAQVRRQPALGVLVQHGPVPPGRHDRRAARVRRLARAARRRAAVALLLPQRRAARRRVHGRRDRRRAAPRRPSTCTTSPTPSRSGSACRRRS